MSKISQLPLTSIQPDADQPRKDFTGDIAREVQDALDGLAASISAHGVLEPILVHALENGQYQLVAGERRWRAARLAGLSSVPCLVVAKPKEASTTAIQLVENIQREGLSELDIAYALRKLATEHQLTQRTMAKMLGKTETWISRHLAIMEASPAVKQAIESGLLTGYSSVSLLTSLPEATQEAMVKHAVETGEKIERRQLVAAQAKAAPAAEAADHIFATDAQAPAQMAPIGDGVYNDQTYDDFTRPVPSVLSVPLSAKADTYPVTAELSDDQMRGLLQLLGKVPPSDAIYLPTELASALAAYKP